MDTRDYLLAAFPQYTEEIVSQLQRNHDGTCRLIASIINHNSQLLNCNDMKTVADYVTQKTGSQSYWEDANTWIGYSEGVLYVVYDVHI